MTFEWGGTPDSSPSVGSSGESSVSGSVTGGGAFVRVLSSVSFGLISLLSRLYVEGSWALGSACVFGQNVPSRRIRNANKTGLLCLEMRPLG